ncbi:phosphoesterase [Brucella melitensis]|uniref:phosphatase PAP2 family protein n=1 Tax=Brucella melitensis TaxID=29459 RepID=UPI00081BDACB|nr:phosphatase PAP2 family protein [Brucella melitensis]OCW12386.1 phosphoesterase [Brucella melitensis]
MKQAHGPDDNRSMWMLMGIGIVCVFGFFIQILVLSRYLDRPLALFMASQKGTALVDIAAHITKFGKAYWFLVPAAALFVFYRFINRSPQKSFNCFFIIASIAVSGIVIKILKIIFGRARPGVLIDDGFYGFTFFRLDREFNSFPSAHTGVAIAAGVALALIMQKHRWVPIILGIVIASSRIIINAHYLSDVVASSLISTVTVLLLYDILGYFGYRAGEPDRHSPDMQGSLKLMSNVIGAPVAEHENGQRPQDGLTTRIIGVINIAAILILIGLIFDFVLIEWFEWQYQPAELIPGWWLPAAITLCALGVGASLYVGRAGRGCARR